jgi:plasmid stabilization system protein ParE
MKPFILTPRAEQDISDIWDYIANDSIQAADRVLAALRNSRTTDALHAAAAEELLIRLASRSAACAL